MIPKVIEYGQLGVFIAVHLGLTTYCVVKVINYKLEVANNKLRPTKNHIEYCFYLLLPFLSFTVLNIASSGLLQLTYRHVKGVDVYYYMYLNFINLVILMIHGLFMGVVSLVRGIKHRVFLVVLISAASTLSIFEVSAVRMMGVLGAVMFVMLEILKPKKVQD